MPNSRTRPSMARFRDSLCLATACSCFCIWRMFWSRNCRLTRMSRSVLVMLLQVGPGRLDHLLEIGSVVMLPGQVIADAWPQLVRLLDILLVPALQAGMLVKQAPHPLLHVRDAA